jgi:tetratricopeptide (TPR) repeat protein/predicted Ser/Thr protein kinase
MPVEMPDRLADRYRVLERLGAGGMATVFLAEDERLGRKVAVKRLHADSPEDAALRFDREAKVGASLSHPNLVTVFDTVADDEGVLIVMEYVDGENVADLIARGRLSPERALDIVGSVAAGLDHAHAAGVIHRDVKPANILVGRDSKAKLVDLGIATATERTQITAAGTVLGTPSYMAPEQLEDGRLTKAADVYALGTVAFELLSGRKARQGRTPMEIAHQIASGPPPNLRELWPDAPPAAAQVLQRAMARDPAQRPSSAGELARELGRALGAHGDSGAVPFQRDERRTRPLAAAAAAPPPRTPTAGRATPPAATYRRGLPRWIPVVGLILVLLVVAGAIASLTSGGRDKAIAPVVPAKKKPARKKSTQQQPAQQQAQSSTQQAPAQPVAGSDPDKGAQLHAQAHDLIDQGQYDQAIALEQQAVRLLDGSDRIEYWYALYDLGHALRLAGRPDEAIAILEKRLQNPNQKGVVKKELEAAKADAGQP